MEFLNMQGCLMALISSVCWFHATKAAVSVENPGVEPHLRLIAQGNHLGYSIGAWISGFFAVIYALFSILK